MEANTICMILRGFVQVMAAVTYSNAWDCELTENDGELMQKKGLMKQGT